MKTIKTFFIIIFISSLCFFSCTSSISHEDRMLSEMIIGRWTSKNFETIVFNDDNSFIDSVWSEIPYSSSKNFVPLFVAEGNYRVNNGMIFFSDVSLTYLRAAADTSVKSFSQIFYPRSVRPSENDMFMQILPTFDYAGSSQKLEGSYSMTNPAVMYNKNGPDKFISGLIKEIYDFNSDEGTCTYIRRYFFDNEQEETIVRSNYSFSHPRLAFSDYDVGFNSFYDVLVIFTGSNMHWVISDNVLFLKEE